MSQKNKYENDPLDIWISSELPINDVEMFNIKFEQYKRKFKLRKVYIKPVFFKSEKFGIIIVLTNNPKMIYFIQEDRKINWDCCEPTEEE